MEAEEAAPFAWQSGLLEGSPARSTLPCPSGTFCCPALQEPLVGGGQARAPSLGSGGEWRQGLAWRPSFPSPWTPEPAISLGDLLTLWALGGLGRERQQGLGPALCPLEWPPGWEGRLPVKELGRRGSWEEGRESRAPTSGGRGEERGVGGRPSRGMPGLGSSVRRDALECAPRVLLSICR